MNKKLVHISHFEHSGTLYEISVYCNGEGHHYAETRLNEDDIIINDGPTLEKVLNKHANLLPLAIDSHKIRKYVYRSSAYEP